MDDRKDGFSLERDGAISQWIYEDGLVKRYFLLCMCGLSVCSRQGPVEGEDIHVFEIYAMV